MEGEIDGLLAQLRAASARIHGELGRAAAGIDQLHDSLPASNGAVQGELEPPRAAPAQAATPELPAPSGLAAPPAQPAVAAPSAQPAVAAPAPSGAEASEIDHARLVAVNMALSGEPREHTERRLRDELGVADPAALVDDVYAAPRALSAEGAAGPLLEWPFHGRRADRRLGSPRAQPKRHLARAAA